MFFPDFLLRHFYLCRFFFFNDTATTEIYTLSLHDALPIYLLGLVDHPHAPAADLAEDLVVPQLAQGRGYGGRRGGFGGDRKSTRLNSSHSSISYAVFCLKKKKHPLRQS